MITLALVIAGVAVVILLLIVVVTLIFWLPILLINGIVSLLTKKGE